MHLGSGSCGSSCSKWHSPLGTGWVWGWYRGGAGGDGGEGGEGAVALGGGGTYIIYMMLYRHMITNVYLHETAAVYR